jgi:hypothetical protein
MQNWQRDEKATGLLTLDGTDLHNPNGLGMQWMHLQRNQIWNENINENGNETKTMAPFH